MNTTEKQKIEDSFRNVKTDVIQIQENLKFILTKLNQLDITTRKLSLNLTKTKITTTKKTIKNYVVSKTGKKLHNPNCLHAQNIKKENIKIFQSKTEALNKGYKLCSCLAY